MADRSSTHTVAIFATSTAAVYALWRLVIKPHLESRKPFPDLPMAGGNHWLLGHIPILKETGFGNEAQRQWMFSSADEKGRTSMWMGPQPTLLVTRWHDARTILQAEYYRKVAPLVGRYVGRAAGEKSILFLSGREWRYHRAAILKSFSPTALQASQAAMAEVTATAVASLRQRILEQGGKYQCPVETLMKMITLDVFGLAAFSYDFGCCRDLQASQIAHAFDLVAADTAERSGKPLAPRNYLLQLPTARNRRAAEAIATIRDFVLEALDDRLRNPSKHYDLLAHLIAVHAEEGDDIDRETLRSIMTGVLFAGYDTTSVTLSYAFYLIAKHPEVESKCLQEIESTSGDLAYCRAVIQETLRMYPPGPAVSRTLLKDLQLDDGRLLKAGTHIIVPIYLQHRNEYNFPRPDDFQPERWARREGSAWVERAPDDTDGPIPAGNRKALFSFSAGGRSCPGQKFARLEAETVLAGLLKAFRFTTISPDYRVRPRRYGVIQHAQDGLPMNIELRAAG